MPSYIGRNLGLSEAMRGLIETIEMKKRRKEQDLQDEFYRSLAERKQTEWEKDREYWRKKEEEKTQQPEVIGGQQTGYGYITPGKPRGTGPYPEEQYQPQYTPIPGLQPPEKPPAVRGFSPGTVYGLEAPEGFRPQGQVPYKPEEETPEPKISDKEFDFYRDIFKATNDPNSPLYGQDPDVLFEQRMRGLGLRKAPRPQRAPLWEEPMPQPQQSNIAEEPEFETAEEVEAFVQENPEYAWLLQSPEYLEMKGR